MKLPSTKNALISVSDKLGVVDFARGLMRAGVKIYSTGGTRRHLENQSVVVEDIAAYTGFPEMMSGRVKTLHPKVFGGILCRRDHPDDVAALEAHEIRQFDLVVVNLYPFEATIAREGVTPEEAVEQIDIGGPSLVRAAAKNHAFVTIATPRLLCGDNSPSRRSPVRRNTIARSRITSTVWIPNSTFRRRFISACVARPGCDTEKTHINVPLCTRTSHQYVART